MIKSIISRHLLNSKGWRTNRKIVVIESDDWGSIRMPSKEVYDKMLKKGIRVDKCPYNKYDSLASEVDLVQLFQVLSKYRDKNNRAAVFTANTVVTNPDFEKIKESRYEAYHYELFTDTLRKYPNHENSWNLWKQGMNFGVFHPQFHGREHVNTKRWLELLKQNNFIFKTAFENKFWGISPRVANYGKINIQATYDTLNREDVIEQKESLREGLKLFESIFGYKSKSFIANNFIWDSELNEVLKNSEVFIIQGMKYQLAPLYNNKKRNKIRHYSGEKNIHNQIYLIRNCSFEPTENPQLDCVSKCLIEISNAFLWQKPAIISSHRLNYIGDNVLKNRTDNLEKLNSLLFKIIKKWPDVEFMTSDEIGTIF